MATLLEMLYPETLNLLQFHIPLTFIHSAVAEWVDPVILH